MNAGGVAGMTIVEPIHIVVVEFGRVDQMFWHHRAPTHRIEPAKAGCCAFVTDFGWANGKDLDSNLLQ